MYKRNREKRSKLNEDRAARAASVGSSSGGTQAAAVVSASQPLAAAPSQRQLRPRRAKTGAQQMDIDESSGNDTEEDAPYLRDPRDDEDTETDADAGADDANDDDDDVDSDDGSEESAAGSSDLEGPIVTPAIQIPIRQAGVEIVSYYNTGMTAAAHLLRRQSPLDVPKDTVDYWFHTRFQQDFYQTVILAKAGIASEAQWVDWTHMANLGHEICNEVAQMCEDRHIKDIMGFQHDWNKEVIAQFYATVYFGHDPENGNERTIY